MSDKEFRLTVKGRNKRLIRAREREGLSCPKMAERIGVCYQALSAYESGCWSPLAAPCKPATWKSTAAKIASYYGREPEYFWPDTAPVVKESQTARELNVDEIELLSGLSHLVPPDPQEVVAQKELRNTIRVLLAHIDNTNPQQGYILRRSYGLDGGAPQTRTEIGEALGLLGATVHRLRMQVLLKLRHPQLSRRLKPFVGGMTP